MMQLRSSESPLGVLCSYFLLVLLLPVTTVLGSPTPETSNEPTATLNATVPPGSNSLTFEARVIAGLDYWQRHSTSEERRNSQFLQVHIADEPSGLKPQLGGTTVVTISILNKRTEQVTVLCDVLEDWQVVRVEPATPQALSQGLWDYPTDLWSTTFGIMLNIVGRTRFGTRRFAHCTLSIPPQDPWRPQTTGPPTEVLWILDDPQDASSAVVVGTHTRRVGYFKKTQFGNEIRADSSLQLQGNATLATISNQFAQSNGSQPIITL